MTRDWARRCIRLWQRIIEAQLVNEELADQVWEAWDKGEIDDQVAWLAWDLIAFRPLYPCDFNRSLKIAILS